MEKGKRINIPRLGISGEMPSDQQEKTPDVHFKVRSIEGGITGHGFIPKEMLESLQDEMLKISGFITMEDRVERVEIEADDIALALGQDGNDPQYAPGNWWAGYANAFKNYRGEVCGEKGRVTLSFLDGEVLDDEEDPDMYAQSE